MPVSSGPKNVTPMAPTLLNGIHGLTVYSDNGPVGTVKDLLVDDHSLLVSHIVVQAGRWYQRQMTFIPAGLLEAVDWDSRTLKVGGEPVDYAPEPICAAHEAADQILSEQAPGTMISRDRNVSHFGSPWEAGESPCAAATGGLATWATVPVTSGDCSLEQDAVYGIGLNQNLGMPHLPTSRSLLDIVGYDIKASDGFAGRIVDVVVAENPGWWRMSALVLKVGPWHTPRQVLLQPENVRWMSWDDQCISVALSRSEIEAGRPFSAVRARNLTTSGERATG